MNNFPVNLNLRIDWSELDLFGHVNNVAFAKYVQASRVHFWEKAGLSAIFKREQVGSILASLKIDYRQPLFFPGDIKIQSRCEFIKNTSFGLHHLILNDNNEIAAEAHDIQVMYDFKNHQKAPIPEELRKALEKLS